MVQDVLSLGACFQPLEVLPVLPRVVGYSDTELASELFQADGCRHPERFSWEHSGVGYLDSSASALAAAVGPKAGECRGMSVCCEVVRSVHQNLGGHELQCFLEMGRSVGVCLENCEFGEQVELVEPRVRLSQVYHVLQCFCWMICWVGCSLGRSARYRSWSPHRPYHCR